MAPQLRTYTNTTLQMIVKGTGNEQENTKDDDCIFGFQSIKKNHGEMTRNASNTATVSPTDRTKETSLITKKHIFVPFS